MAATTNTDGENVEDAKQSKTMDAYNARRAKSEKYRESVVNNDIAAAKRERRASRNAQKQKRAQQAGQDGSDAQRRRSRSRERRRQSVDQANGVTDRNGNGGGLGTFRC
jgi:hypothetical protein